MQERLHSLNTLPTEKLSFGALSATITMPAQVQHRSSRLSDLPGVTHAPTTRFTISSERLQEDTLASNGVYACTRELTCAYMCVGIYAPHAAAGYG